LLLVLFKEKINKKISKSNFSNELIKYNYPTANIILYLLFKDENQRKVNTYIEESFTYHTFSLRMGC